MTFRQHCRYCNILQLVQKSGGIGAYLIFLWIYPVHNAGCNLPVSSHTDRVGTRNSYDPRHTTDFAYRKSRIYCGTTRTIRYLIVIEQIFEENLLP